MNETDKKSGKPDKPQKSRLNLWISDKTSESLDSSRKNAAYRLRASPKRRSVSISSAIAFTVKPRRVGRLT